MQGEQCDTGLARNQLNVTRSPGAIMAWCAEAQHSGWVKPAIRVFSWPCTQLT